MLVILADVIGSFVIICVIARYCFTNVTIFQAWVVENNPDLGTAPNFPMTQTLEKCCYLIGLIWILKLFRKTSYLQRIIRFGGGIILFLHKVGATK